MRAVANTIGFLAIGDAALALVAGLMFLLSFGEPDLDMYRTGTAAYVTLVSSYLLWRAAKWFESQA